MGLGDGAGAHRRRRDLSALTNRTRSLVYPCLGPNWTDMAVGGLAIANDAVTGTNANGNSGGIRTAETYTSDDSELAIRLLTEQLPWLSWMPRAEQVECLSEILTHLAAGAETGTFEPFARAVAEWEHTAEVWADPELAKRLSSDIRGDGRAIPRPKAQPSSGA